MKDFLARCADHLACAGCRSYARHRRRRAFLTRGVRGSARDGVRGAWLAGVVAHAGPMHGIAGGVHSVPGRFNESAEPTERPCTYLHSTREAIAVA